MRDARGAGFKETTRLGTALDRLREAVTPLERTETLPLSTAVGRVLAESVAAPLDVPHYDRAAMDGYALRGGDTTGATEGSPAVLAAAEDRVEDRTAVPVSTGDPVPPGADAVVRVEDTTTRGDDVEVLTPVPPGENVAPAGEDVAAGETVFEAGHRVRASDLALLKSVGQADLRVYQRPTVGVVPTGSELVEREPDPGEVVETNGLTVSTLVERWGGEPTYRDAVTDDEHALRAAIQRDLTKDVVVTTGGSSVGDFDLVPDVVGELGEVLVHGVSIRPGHPVGLGLVDERPVLVLPGYPVSCLVTAVQLLRPALKWTGRLPLPDHPTAAARLDGKLPSAVGERTFARVTLAGADGEGGSEEAVERVATPVRTGGAGVLSSVTEADGWVVVPESREGVPAGETVAVQDWGYLP